MCAGGRFGCRKRAGGVIAHSLGVVGTRFAAIQDDLVDGGLQRREHGDMILSYLRVAGQKPEHASAVYLSACSNRVDKRLEAFVDHRENDALQHHAAALRREQVRERCVKDEARRFHRGSHARLQAIQIKDASRESVVNQLSGDARDDIRPVVSPRRRAKAHALLGLPDSGMLCRAICHFCANRLARMLVTDHAYVALLKFFEGVRFTKRFITLYFMFLGVGSRFFRSTFFLNRCPCKEWAGGWG